MWQWLAIFTQICQCIGHHVELITCSTFSAAHCSRGRGHPLALSAERQSIRTKSSRAHGVRARKLARAFWWAARAAHTAPPGKIPDGQSSCSHVGGTTRTRCGHLPRAAPSCCSGSKAGEKVNVKGHSFNSEAGAPDLTCSGLESISHSKIVHKRSRTREVEGAHVRH